MGDLHEYKVSETFHDGSADLTFRSSDHVLFKVHSANLSVVSEGFVVQHMTISKEEFADLPEKADALNLLFAYAYPRDPPELDKYELDVVVRLAEAVFKYQIYPAKAACLRSLRERINERPFAVLAFAVRHHLIELQNTAAIKSLGKPVHLPHQLIGPYRCPLASCISHNEQIEYERKWTAARAESLELYPSSADSVWNSHGRSSCEQWPVYHTFMVRCLKDCALEEIGVDRVASSTLSPALCYSCDRATLAWSEKIRNNIATIPTFHELYKEVLDRF